MPIISNLYLFTYLLLFVEFLDVRYYNNVRRHIFKMLKKYTVFTLYIYTFL